MRPTASRSECVGAASSSRDGEGHREAPVAVCVRERSLRDRICATLEAGGHPVELRVAGVDDLLGCWNGAGPVCLVITAERPDRATVEAVRAIRPDIDAQAVVLICRRAGAAQVRRALELGVDGVVLVDQIEAALSAVVEAVCAGQVSVPGERRREVRTMALTNREKQILALVVGGLTNAQIARELYLAESTVKSHLSSAFMKLGVSSRNEAVAVILDPVRGSTLGIRGMRPEIVAASTA